VAGHPSLPPVAPASRQSRAGRELLSPDSIVPMSDAQQLVKIRAPRVQVRRTNASASYLGCDYHDCSGEVYHEESFEIGSHAGDRRLDDPGERRCAGTRTGKGRAGSASSPRSAGRAATAAGCAASSGRATAAGYATAASYATTPSHAAATGRATIPGRTATTGYATTPGTAKDRGASASSDATHRQ